MVNWMTKKYFEDSDDHTTVLINLYKQLMMEKLKHGDDISLDIIDDDDQFYTVYGKLYIHKENKDVYEFYICHNDDRYNGASSPDSFGYKYSWHFIVNPKTGQPFSDKDLKNLKKIEAQENTIILDNGEVFMHGDLVVATIQDKKVEGKICINKSKNHTYLFICQNEHNGNPDADEKFGYEYSWGFSIVNGKFPYGSSVTKIVHHVQSVVHTIDYDDDPMPLDWVMTEKIPDDL